MRDRKRPRFLGAFCVPGPIQRLSQRPISRPITAAAEAGSLLPISAVRNWRPPLWSVRREAGVEQASRSGVTGFVPRDAVGVGPVLPALRRPGAVGARRSTGALGFFLPSLLLSRCLARAVLAPVGAGAGVVRAVVADEVRLNPGAFSNMGVYVTPSTPRGPREPLSRLREQSHSRGRGAGRARTGSLAHSTDVPERSFLIREGSVEAGTGDAGISVRLTSRFI